MENTFQETNDEFSKFTLDELRTQQENLKNKFEPKIFIAETEAQKEYLKKVNSETKKELTFEQLLNKAKNINQKHIFIIRGAANIEYEAAKELFWSIYKHQIKSFGKTPYFNEDMKFVLKNLILYFSGQPGAYDLKKGIWLCGCIGGGKSTLMQSFSIFSKTLNHYPFEIAKVRHIANELKRTKDYETLAKYSKKSYCFDDVGSEDRTNIFGNQSDIMEQIIEENYELNYTKGFLSHATSNISIEDISDRYSDPRIVSRIREMYNNVFWISKDLRI